MKRISKIIVFLAATLILVEAVAYFFQHRLIFQSTKLKEEYAFKFDKPFQEYFIDTPDNEKLNVLWFTPEAAAKGIVIYFHGNASNLQRWGKYAVDLTSLGYEVVMMDYRGYGKSTGYAKEDLLYQDARLLWNWVKEKSNHDTTILYGRSLGSAVATQLASEVQPDLLILETPFDEVRNARMAQIFYAFIPLHYNFPTKDFLPQVTCKKVIMHGTDDWVVPLSAAAGLKPILSNTDEFVIIQGGGHRNLRDFELYHATLKRVLP